MSQHGRHSDPGPGGVNLGLIITPMLDMSFQIMAFFIMTYHPSAFEGQVNGKLVPPMKARVVAPDPKLEDDVAPNDMHDLVEVQVSVQAIPKGGNERFRKDGEPANISIKNAEDAAPRQVAGADERIEESFNRLRARLRESLAGGAGRGNIRLDCAGDLKHRYVMEIYDICKGAGFQNVSFVAPVK